MSIGGAGQLDCGTGPSTVHYATHVAENKRWSLGFVTQGRWVVCSLHVVHRQLPERGSSWHEGRLSTHGGFPSRLSYRRHEPNATQPIITGQLFPPPREQLWARVGDKTPSRRARSTSNKCLFTATNFLVEATVGAFHFLVTPSCQMACVTCSSWLFLTSPIDQFKSEADHVVRRGGASRSADEVKGGTRRIGAGL